MAWLIRAALFVVRVGVAGGGTAQLHQPDATGDRLHRHCHLRAELLHAAAADAQGKGRMTDCYMLLLPMPITKVDRQLPCCCRLYPRQRLLDRLLHAAAAYTQGKGCMIDSCHVAASHAQGKGRITGCTFCAVAKPRARSTADGHGRCRSRCWQLGTWVDCCLGRLVASHNSLQVCSCTLCQRAGLM